MDTDMKYADSVQEAKALAQEQLDKFPPMPENTAAVDACPGVDPMGKYSAIDMKFAQRQARIIGALQSRSPEVQVHVKGVLQSFQHSQQCSDLGTPSGRGRQGQVTEHVDGTGPKAG